MVEHTVCMSAEYINIITIKDGNEFIKISILSAKRC